MLPDQKKLKFEKIKVNCFFNCSNKTLNLLNYPTHIKTCKENYESKMSKLNEKFSKDNSLRRDTLHKPYSLHSHHDTDKINLNLIEKEAYSKLKQLIQVLSEKINNKDKINKSLQTQLIDINKELITSKKILSQTNNKLLILEESTQNLVKELRELHLDLQEKSRENTILTNKFDKDKENFLREIAHLEKMLELQTTQCKLLEKANENLTEEKNNLLMFNSNSITLSEAELAFRKLIQENIDPELRILNLNNKKLEDIHMEYLSHCEFLNKLTSLDINNNNLVTVDGVKFLGDCVFIKNLTEFKMRWCLKGKEGMDYLKKFTFLEKLTDLDLSSLEIKDVGLSTFSQCDFLTNLTALNLSNNGITPDGISHLKESSFLSKLLTLNISKNEVENIYLNQYPYFSKLTYLDLSENNFKSINDINKSFELQTLILSKNTKMSCFVFCNNYLIKMPKLTILDLSDCMLGNNLKSLLNFDIFDSLVEFNLDNNNIKNDGIYDLSSNLKKLTNLKRLIISSNTIREIGVKYLIDCEYKNLTKLYINGNEIGKIGMENLLKCDYKFLRQLNLNQCNIGVEGAEILVKCGFKFLTELNLARNDLRKGGMEFIIKCELSSLIFLSLYQNYIGDEGMELLSKCDLKSLIKIDLETNAIGNAGVKSLSMCNFNLIEDINLSSNLIDKESTEYFAQFYFKNLTKINIAMNDIEKDNKSIEKVKEIFQGVEVYYFKYPYITRPGDKEIVDKEILDKELVDKEIVDKEIVDKEIF